MSPCSSGAFQKGGCIDSIVHRTPLGARNGMREHSSGRYRNTTCKNTCASRFLDERKYRVHQSKSASCIATLSRFQSLTSFLGLLKPYPLEPLFTLHPEQLFGGKLPPMLPRTALDLSVICCLLLPVITKFERLAIDCVRRPYSQYFLQDCFFVLHVVRHMLIVD